MIQLDALRNVCCSLDSWNEENLKLEVSRSASGGIARDLPVSPSASNKGAKEIFQL